MIKFADDMALVVRLQVEDLLAQVQVLTNWFDDSFLQLNVSKTKELILDRRRIQEVADPIIIAGRALSRSKALNIGEQ